MWKQIKPDEVIPKLADKKCIVDVDLRNMSVDYACSLRANTLLRDLKSSECFFFEEVKNKTEVLNVDSN